MPVLSPQAIVRGNPPSDTHEPNPQELTAWMEAQEGSTNPVLYGARTAEAAEAMAARMIDGQVGMMGGLGYTKQSSIPLGASVTEDLGVAGLNYAGVLNVEHSGATGDGDDTAKFQAAIDALPADGGIIELAEGVDYTVTISSLNVGSKRVFWMGAASINGVPTLSNLPGVSISVHQGAYQLLYNFNDTTGAGNPVLRVRRKANYNADGVNPSAFKVESEIGPDCRAFEYGQTIELTTEGTDSSQQHVGSYVRAVKEAASQVKFWGMAYSVINRSLVSASVVGAEWNVRALGDHTNPGDPRFGTGLRYNLDVILSTADDLAATDRATFDAGINVIANGGTKAATVKSGMVFQDETDGVIETGINFNLDNAITGIQFGGTFSGDAINMACNAVYGVDFTAGTFSGGALRLGDDQKLVLNDGGTIAVAWDSANTQIEFLNSTTVMLAIDNTNNALKFRVGGSLKQVEQGDADSAGSGYRTLRVVN